MKTLLISMLLVALPAQAARYALLVGNNQGHTGEAPLRFAESDAAKMREVLTELGSFEASRVTVLRTPTAQAVTEALSAVAEKIRAEGDREALLLFYYSGHADGAALHLGEGTLELSALRELLQQSGAAVRVGILDACGTGALTSREKGLERQPPFLVTAPKELSTRGQVIIAAVSESEAAQESDALKGSFFSSYLVSGLRGAADRSARGKVTLEEAYRYAYAQTVRSTLLSTAGVQHPSYDMDLSGQGELVLTEPRLGRARLTFAAQQPGEFAVFTPNEELVAQVGFDKGGEALFALPAGDYEVRKRSPDGLRVAAVKVAEGEERQLREERMDKLDYVHLAKKGGFNASGVASVGYAAGVLASPWGAPMLRAGVEGHLGNWVLAPGLSFGHVGWSGTPSGGSAPASVDELFFGLGATFTRPFEFGRAELRVGPAVDGLFVVQTAYGIDHLSLALAPGAAVALRARMSSNLSLGAELLPEAMLTHGRTQLLVRPILQTTLGARYDF